MTDVPYTQKRFDQYRGPQNSDEYNQMVEEHLKDLSYLYNKQSQTDNNMDKGYGVFAKELIALAKYITFLEPRIAAVEAASKTLSFVSSTQIDNDRFNSTSYNVNAVDRCTFNDSYNLLSLPKVFASSMSKIKYQNDDGNYNVPSSLQTFVAPITPSADNTSAVVETSQPYNAIVGKPGRVWERNITTTAADPTNGAQMYFYVTIPNELSSTSDTNCIEFTPYPMNNIDILEIAYTTDPNVNLATTAQWTVFNSDHLYSLVPQAIGGVMPGAWTGDTLVNCKPRLFYFQPLPITAIRFKIRQRMYLTEAGKFIYSYGMSKLDIRFDKFLDTGKAMIRFDVPNSGTLSSITSVTPQMWNTPEFSIGDAFSYRVIWETAFNSGTYTLNPVPLSKRVWLEVTLNRNINGSTPALTGLILKYS